jgi:hypothetical protein
VADTDAKARFDAFVEAFGFAPVDLGSLSGLHVLKRETQLDRGGVEAHAVENLERDGLGALAGARAEDDQGVEHAISVAERDPGRAEARAAGVQGPLDLR